jgi:biopolymer transport protein ExbD
MARSGRLRKITEENTDLDMVPIMNLFMVLIPFLLISASFLHIKAINTSIPVHSAGRTDDVRPKPEAKVTAIVSLYQDRIELSAMCESLPEKALSEFETTVKKTADIGSAEPALVAVLKKIKAEYPASDTMLLVPAEAILYDEIIRAMDMARNMEADVLFPNVVLAGSLG